MCRKGDTGSVLKTWYGGRFLGKFIYMKAEKALRRNKDVSYKRKQKIFNFAWKVYLPTSRQTQS